MEYLKSNCAISGVRRASGRLFAVCDKVAGKVMCTVNDLLNKRTYSRTVTSSGSGVHSTEITSGEHMFAKFINDLIVINRRQVALLDLVKNIRVPHKDKVIRIIRAQELIVVVVAAYIFEVYEKVCDSLCNNSTLNAGSLFTGGFTDGGRYTNRLSLFADSTRHGANISIISGRINNLLSVSEPALHNAVELSKGTLGTPCTFRHIVIGR